MARPKKQKDSDWLQADPLPSEVETSPFGGFHIPIDKLRPLLDKINGSTFNYKVAVLKSGYDEITAYGSIELRVTIDGKERTVTGAYNLITREAINNFWNGTLKSECIKNASMELGKRLGRELNKDVPKPEPTQVAQMVSSRISANPDDKIMKQYRAAIERNDEAAIATLRNIYPILKETDATQG